MKTRNLLYKKNYAINHSINIYIPSVGEVIDNEDEYYSLVSAFTAMPIDMMVQLDDIGIDFSTINEYELFLLLLSDIKEHDTSLILGELDLTKFNLAINKENGEVFLIDEDNDIRIDREIHFQISNVLRLINHIKKDKRNPGNSEAKDFMLKRARTKMKRNRNRTEISHLESLIIAMVNAEQYKYDFEGTRNLSIYQFNESVRQIIQKVDYDNRMHGVYAGTINPKELSQDDFNWLTHK